MNGNLDQSALGLPLNPLVETGALSPVQRAALLGGEPWRVVQEHSVGDQRLVNRALQRDASRGVQGVRLNLDSPVDWSLLCVGLDLSTISLSLNSGAPSQAIQGLLDWTEGLALEGLQLGLDPSAMELADVSDWLGQIEGRQRIRALRITEQPGLGLIDVLVRARDAFERLLDDGHDAEILAHHLSLELFASPRFLTGQKPR